MLSPQDKNSFISAGIYIIVGVALGLLAGAVISYAIGQRESANSLGLFVLYFLAAGIILRLIGHLRKSERSEKKH